MYRTSQDYNRIVRIITEIYEDYGIFEFPLNAFELCKKMQIKLIPYSSMDDELFELSKKKSLDGYYYKTKRDCIIFYNDTGDIKSPARIEFTLLHELKHIVCNDKDDSDFGEDMAEYFAKFSKCPIPYLVINNITEVFDIMAKFNVTQSVASFVSNNVKNRMAKYGRKIFDYEVPLLMAIVRNQLIEVDKLRDINGKLLASEDMFADDELFKDEINWMEVVDY